MNIVKFFAADSSNKPNDWATWGLKQAGGDDASKDTFSSSLQVALNWVFGIIGIVAVIMIILGGFTMMTSSGDPGKVKKGKDTILYGVIGLVVALLAFAIVNFVLANVFKTSQ